MKSTPSLKTNWSYIQKMSATILLIGTLNACELGKDNTNIQPIASAGNDTSIPLTEAQRSAGNNISFTLNARSSRDNDGKIVSYYWEVISSDPANLLPLINIEAPNQISTAVLVPPTEALYKLQVTVTDDAGDSDIDIVYLSLGLDSIPDQKTASVTTLPDQSVVSGDIVNLEAIKNNFSDPVSYSWRRISTTPLGYDIDDKKKRVASFIAPEVTEATQFVFEVVAFTRTQTAQATTKVTVSQNISAIPNMIPVAIAGPDMIIPSGEQVTLKGFGSDNDGTINRVQWAQIQPINGYTINLLNSQTAEATFTAPDVTELTALSFSFQVTDDDNDSGSDTAIITIKPKPIAANNSPPYAQAGPSKNVTENDSVSLSGTATDSDGSIDSFAWLQIGGPAVTLTSPGGGNCSASANCMFTAPTVIQNTDLDFQLTVTDNLGATSVDITVITVRPSSANIPPTVSAGLDKTVAEGTTVNITGIASDSDGSIASFLWSQVSKANSPDVTLLQSANSGDVSFVAPSVNQVTLISLELRVTDNRDTAAVDLVDITVNPNPNSIPTSIAGADQSANEGEQVLLNGSGSDADGTISGYQWNQISGPRISFQSATSASATFLAPAVSQISVLILELVVTDNNGANASDTLFVTISPINAPPTANAGPDQSVDSNADVQLSGSGLDSDGTISNYNWTQTAGPIISLTNSQTTSPIFTAPNLTRSATITLSLTVTDNNGDTASDQILITVRAANIAPVANAGGPPNPYTSGDSISITGNGSDNDGSVVGFKWSQVSGPTVALDFATQTNSTINFIAPTVTQTSIVKLQLTVTDNNGATGSATVDITINPANLIPTANAGPNISAFSGDLVSIVGIGSDSDGTILSYRWLRTAGPLATLLNGNTDTVSFFAPTVSRAMTMTIELTVTDDSNATATDLVDITISPASNILPVANAGLDKAVSSGANVTVTGNGSDIDGTINGFAWTQTAGTSVNLVNANTSAVSFTAPVVTVNSLITLQLTVTDNSGGTAIDSMLVTVIPAVNIPPVASAGLPKTVASGSAVSVVGSGSDGDGTIASYLWAQTAGTRVILSGATTPTVSFTAPTVTTQSSMTLQLEVTDDGGAKNVASVLITISPAANVLPIAVAGPAKTVKEGTTVTLTGSGSDADGSISSYSWRQVNGTSVTLINANTAALSFVAPQVLSTSVVTMELSVTDNQGGVGSDQVIVTVNPVNNIPTANAGLDLTVRAQDPVTVTGSGTDIDGSIRSYQWTQLNGPTVNLVNANSAVMTFTAPAVTIITTLELQLTVTDNNAAPDSDIVLIIVNPINILPVANAGVDQLVTQGATVALMGTGTDTDGNIVDFQWSQVSGTPLVNLTGANSANATFIAPPVAAQTTIGMQLTVTDNGGATAIDVMLVTLNPGNIPPIANAGPGINADSGALVNLSGAASTDPDGSIVAYQWTQIAAASPVNIINPNTVSPRFTAPVVGQDPLLLFFQLTVTDNLNSKNSIIIFVSIFPPTTLSGRISTSVNNMVDTDINDANTTPISNNDIVTAQHIVNPVVLGGYVNKAGFGASGNSFVAGDDIDVFHVSLNANQSITAYVGFPVPGINELGLELLNLSGQVVAASLSGTALETVSSAVAGNYFVRITAQVGATNYILTIGAAPLQVQSTGWSLSDDFIVGDVIVEFKQGNQPLKRSLAFQANAIGLQAKAGAAGRSMLMGINKSNKTRAFNKLAIGNLPRVTAINALQNKLDTLIAAAALRQRTDVKSVRLNYRYYINQVPNDPNYDLQWHYPNINLPLAWDTTTGSSNVIVAVIDTGVLLDHPDLSQPGKLVPGYDFIRSDANSNDGQPGIDPDPYDVGDGGGQVASSFHGTHVSGTIAASTSNGVGIAGVAWGARIMPLRVIGLNGGSSYDIEQAILFAAGLPNDSGTVPAQIADVINISLGGPTQSIIAPAPYSQARAKNVIIVAAAGNNASSNPTAPAAYNGVVSVSATTISKQLAGYSNFGTTIDIAAPGGSSGDLNGDGFQDRIFSTGGNDSSGTIRFNYNLKMGTSMASPHVAGVIALMKSVFPGMTPSDFDNMLFRGELTQDLGPTGRDNSFGYGLVDAAKAVLAAQTAAGNAPPPPLPPILSVTPNIINYGVGLVSSDIVVQNIGTGNLNVLSVTNTANGWVNVAPLSIDANGLGTYTVTVSRSSLVEGIYNANLNITSQNNGSVSVSISMQVSINNSQVNAGRQYIELLDANTSAVVDRIQINPVNGFYDFSFTNVLIGQYTIRSGSDLDNDGVICELGESCGAYPTFLGGTGTNIIDANGNSPIIPGLDFETGFKISLPAQ